MTRTAKREQLKPGFRIRPCVVWGLGVPEFGVVRGVEGDEYLCVAGGATPERLRWDALDAPGGPYVIAFPTVTRPLDWRHRFAVGRAIGPLRAAKEADTRALEALRAVIDVWPEEEE